MGDLLHLWYMVCCIRIGILWKKLPKLSSNTQSLWVFDIKAATKWWMGRELPIKPQHGMNNLFQIKPYPKKGMENHEESHEIKFLFVTGVDKCRRWPRKCCPNCMGFVSTHWRRTGIGLYFSPSKFSSILPLTYVD